MKIRIINENDWEKAYYYDKDIIRVGSQLGCDIQLKGQNIQPIHLQLIVTNGAENGAVVRAFADGVTLTRGAQVQNMVRTEAYDLIEGDTITLENYRIIIEFGNEHTRVRTSRSIAAELMLYKTELEPDLPLSGLITLKNIGTEHACQFHIEIHGVPKDCVRTQPMPYLYPGGEGTTGFVITHLGTRPEPGFHTLSISLTAPDDYFGETLEFNQNIYVAPVFNNVISLTDDSSDLMNVNDTLQSMERERSSAQTQAAAAAIDAVTGQTDVEEPADEKDSIVVISADDKKKTDFSDEEDGENEEVYAQGMSMRGRKSDRKVVKKAGTFAGEEPSKPVKDASDSEKAPEAEKKEHKPKAKREPAKKKSAPVVEPEPVKEESAPAVEPEPVKEESAPVVEPEPVKEESAPVVEPEPVKEEPAPVVEPEPVKEEPAPVVEPEPVKEEPAPVVEPEPVKEEPAPENKTVAVPVVRLSGMDAFADESGDEPEPETPAAPAVKIMKGGSFDV